MANSENKVVAVALLSEADLSAIGESFRRLFWVEETPCFSELLLAIDEADRAIRQERTPELRDRRRADQAKSVKFTRSE